MTTRFTFDSRPLSGGEVFGYIVGMYPKDDGNWVQHSSVDHDDEAREFYDTVRRMHLSMSECWCDIQSYIEEHFDRHI